MPTPKLADADIARTVEAFAHNNSDVDATAAALGMGRQAVRRRLEAHATRAAHPPKQPLPPREKQGLQDKVNRLEAQLREIHRDSITAEEVRERIFGLAAHVPEPPKWLLRVESSKGVSGVPSTIWSDWHLGEVVSRAETNGVNEFNYAIAEQRIQRLVARTVDLCYRHMSSPSYPGIVVNVLGDIVSGGIHPELAESDEDDVFPTILWAADRLIWALTTLAAHFPQIYVPAVPGNHGRVFDRKPRAKSYVYRNADWLVYNIVERHFKAIGDKRIQFSIPATGEALYRIYDHRYMGVHGDDLGVKGGDGIIGAIGPIMRGEIKMRHSSAQIGRDYDTLLMGHWHQSLPLPRAIVNNCLKGYDEYARRMLRAVPTPPSQALWFTHPTRGITCRWEVALGEKLSKAPAPWVSWTEEAA